MTTHVDRAADARRPIAYLRHPSSLDVPTRIYALLGVTGGAFAVLAMCLAVLAKLGGMES